MSIKTEKGTAINKAYISGFYGQKEILIGDTITISESFSQQIKLDYQGFYRIGLNNKFVDVILTNNDTIVVNYDPITEIIKVDGSRKIKQFQNLKLQLSEIQQREIGIKSINSNSLPDSLKSTILEQLYQLNNKLIENFCNENDDSCICALASLNKIPLGKEIASIQTQALEFLSLSNPCVIRTNLFPIKVIDFYSLFIRESEEGFITATNLLLNNAKNDLVKKYLYEFLITLFFEVGPKDIARYIVENHSNNDNCSSPELSNLINNLFLLKVGQEMPALNCNGKNIKLSKKKKNIIIIFSSSCPYCESTIVKAKDLSKTYHIIGISLDSDYKDYEAFIKKHKINFTTFHDEKGFESDNSRNLGIYKTPTIIVTDGKTILNLDNLPLK